MMNPKATNLQRTTSSSGTVPGGRLTVRVLEFLFKPLLKAQWQAGYEIGLRPSGSMEHGPKTAHCHQKNFGGDVVACVQYENWLSNQRIAPNNAHSPK